MSRYPYQTRWDDKRPRHNSGVQMFDKTQSGPFGFLHNQHPTLLGNAGLNFVEQKQFNLVQKASPTTVYKDVKGPARHQVISGQITEIQNLVFCHFDQPTEREYSYAIKFEFSNLYFECTNSDPSNQRLLSDFYWSTPSPGNGWDPNTLTWNNKPAVDGSGYVHEIGRLWAGYAGSTVMADTITDTEGDPARTVMSYINFPIASGARFHGVAFWCSVAQSVFFAERTIDGFAQMDEIVKVLIARVG